jgi:hypothetical protein
MKTFSRLIAAVVFLAFGCGQDDAGEIRIFSFSYDFSNGTQGWEADFTEYPVGVTDEADSVYHWEAGHRVAPAETNGHNAFVLSCDNLSGDVFMFLKGKIGGLRPNAGYNVVFEIDLHSNATAGQGIILKAGTSDIEPRKVIENGYFVLNIDKGAGTASGENAISFGDIGAPSYNYPYDGVTKGNSSAYQPFIARTNSKGELWVIIGTDSYYEGYNAVFFTRINLIFSVSE